MMYTCAPAGSASHSSSRRKLVKRGNKTLSVDLHCHVHVPEAAAVAKQTAMPPVDPLVQHGSQRTADRQHWQNEHIHEKATSTELRLKEMDKMGIDVQAISTSPSHYYYRIEPELGRKTSRIINERLASIVASHPDRFVALGTVPMQDPQMAIAELEYCMKELNFKGLELGTNVRKKELADPMYEKFWAKVEELGALIFLHPAGFTDTSRLKEHFLTNVIGNPLDTTFALTHIVYGGILERYPDIKFVAAHGGGYLGGYPARMDHAYNVRPECHDFIKKTPRHYMKKIYWDTMVFGQEQLEHLVKLWGADHVVIGTDYPYDMGWYKPVDFVEKNKALSREQKDLIIGGNAAKLLGLKAKKR